MLHNYDTTLQGWANNREISQPIVLVRGEADGRKITMRLLDGGVPLDLTGAAAVTLVYIKPDKTEEWLPCTTEDAAGGLVSAVFTAQSGAAAGDMEAVTIRITWQDGANSRYAGPRIRVLPSPSDDAIESSTEYAALDVLLAQLAPIAPYIPDVVPAVQGATDAAQAANDAASAANTAATSATSAATSANDAADRAEAAAEDAENALPKTGGTITGDLAVLGALNLGAAGLPALATSSSGSNTNGTWVRLNNGLQICWISTTGLTGLTISNAYGTTAWYTGTYIWTFPAAFSGSVSVAGSVRWGTGGNLTQVSSVNSTSAEFMLIDTYSRSASSGRIFAIAIGWA